MANTISEKTRRRIEEGLRNWDDLNSPARKRYEALRPKYDVMFKRLSDATDESERITAADLGITINAR